MSIHESGFGGMIRTNASPSYIWESTGGSTDIRSWRYTESAQLLDCTYMDSTGYVLPNTRRQWMLGLLDRVEAWIDILVPYDWLSGGVAASGLRAGDSYTVYLWRNSAKYITFAGVVIGTDFSCPLDGPNTCTIHIVGTGGATTYSP